MNALLFRRSTESDIPFYESLLNDTEWIYNSGFRKEDFQSKNQIINFISTHNDKDLKGIVVNATNNEDIGFCHFKYLGSDKYEITGGIKKEILNKGYGVYCFVYCIDYLFNNRICTEIQSVVYEFNMRSKKINLKTGFTVSKSLYYDVRKFDINILTPKNFYDNLFTKYILSKCK